MQCLATPGAVQGMAIEHINKLQTLDVTFAPDLVYLQKSIRV